MHGAAWPPHRRWIWAQHNTISAGSRICDPFRRNRSAVAEESADRGYIFAHKHLSPYVYYIVLVGGSFFLCCFVCFLDAATLVRRLGRQAISSPSHTKVRCTRATRKMESLHPKPGMTDGYGREKETRPGARAAM